MTKNPALAGTLPATLETTLVMEFARLLNEHMAQEEGGAYARLRWQASLEDFSLLIGKRYAYLTLRRVGFRPSTGDVWERAARHSEGDFGAEWLESDGVAALLTQAIGHLDPQGELRSHWGTP